MTIRPRHPSKFNSVGIGVPDVSSVSNACIADGDGDAEAVITPVLACLQFTQKFQAYIIIFLFQHYHVC
jgi:hypothetical protein